jgi:UDP-N-acetylglucosamine 2-epimerase
MGERPDSILTVGCPSSDLARRLDRRLDASVLHVHGSGAHIDPAAPYRLVVFHPDTTGFGTERAQMVALLGALDDTAMPTLLLWPNIDAGSNALSKVIRQFRDRVQPPWLRLLTNLAPDDYLRVLAGAAVAVGNSSSFVRDASFFGTPVVLVGARQDGRERDAHVLRVDCRRDAVAAAIEARRQAGHWPPSRLYGDGHVSERVAAALPGRARYVKRLAYAEVAGS